MQKSKRILIISDDLGASLFLRTSLEVAWPDVEVMTVVQHDEAIELVRSFGVDILLISDSKDYASLISELHRLTPRTPIMLLTRNQDLIISSELREMGITAVFSFPYAVDEIAAAARDALTRSQYRVQESGQIDPELSNDIAKILTDLRAAIGVEQALLLNKEGQVLSYSGNDVARVNEEMLQLLASIHVAAQTVMSFQPQSSDMMTNQVTGGGATLLTINLSPRHILVLQSDSEIGDLLSGSKNEAIRGARYEIIWLIGLVHPTITEPEPAAVLEDTDEPEPELDDTSEKSELIQPEIDQFWEEAAGAIPMEYDDLGMGGLSMEEAKSQGFLTAGKSDSAKSDSESTSDTDQ